MPVAPTYPGVYIEEIPSGVRTITGVSTSVTAFIGGAARGPINKATHVLSFPEFERRFGGLDQDSEMSYGVRQFFMNGGSDAWIVRIAKGAVAAFKDLLDASSAPALKLTALDAGFTGNEIQVRVDYNTASPASTFNLTLSYVPSDSPGDAVTERFENLSMNSKDARYVADVVAASSLASLQRTVPTATLNGLGQGTSTGGRLIDNSNNLLDVAFNAGVLDSSHNTLRISANGLPPVRVELAPGDITGATAAARLTSLCGKIADAVHAQAAGRPAYDDPGFKCEVFDTNRIKFTSGQAGENSTVQVLPGERNDATGRLKLGVANGGVETDAAAGIRPVEMPNPGTLTSGAFGATDLNTLPDATHTSLVISIDGYGPDTVGIGAAAAAGANLDAKLGDVASRIQTAVRALKPANPSYSQFTVTIDTANKKLVLASGSRGKDSTVRVFAATTNSIANELHLLAGAITADGANVALAGGNEAPYGPADVYNLIIANRANREGLYALDGVDLFNLLCIPGVTDPGVLADADAYCKERRAFFVIDSPPDKEKPEEMLQVVQGTDLPKSDYAAVYYPWIKIADPLKNGRLRSVAPSGTIAGLCARTDGTRGVWKAPAGTDATLAGVQGVDYQLSDPQNGTLNPLGVNCVRVFPVFGAVAWGARTLRGADQMASEYKYLPVRRLALFLEESLYRGTKWIVFEPNDERLWAQIRLNVGAFMNSLFRQGAFQGTSPREAYLVKCDKETTTQDDINRGIVNILVGFAPLKPAEFVIIKIQQLAGQIQT